MQTARQTATSSFLQQSSVIHVTDFDKRKTIRDICQQDYVGANGDLFIFIVDLYRNQQIRQQSGNDDGRVHNTDVFFQAYDDTILAIQNVANMAESLGLGTVFVGNIVNDSAKLNHKETRRDEILDTLHRQELCLH